MCSQNDEFNKEISTMKRNLIYLSLIVIMLACGQAVTAQKNCTDVCCDSVAVIEKRAKVMSKKLMLDDKTAAKFIPLYESYMNELAQCRKQKDKCAATDAERLDNLENRFATEAQRAEIKKRYVSEFAKILTPMQVEKVLLKNGKMKGQGRKAPECDKKKNCGQAYGKCNKK